MIVAQAFLCYNFFAHKSGQKSYEVMPMKCPHCGADISEDEVKCPYCFGILNCGDAANCLDDVPATKKKLNKLIPIISSIIIVAAAVMFFLLRSGGPNSEAASYKSYTLTNRELNYYYWSDYYYYLSSYGSSAAFDAEKPLSDQKYSDTMTWQDYFINSAVGNWRDITAVSNAALAEGFTLPAEYQTGLESLTSNLETAASNLKLESAEEYLTYSYGKAADYDSFYAFLEANYLANAYSDHIYDEFYDQYATEPVTAKTINVRHILIGNDAFDDPKAKADEVYNLYLSGEKTEDAFAALAEEYSSDEGSKSNGGLYSNVTEGQMVDTFNAWCFDPVRQQGDTGIVQTQFGYHIMYFCGEGEPQSQADDSIAKAKYYEWLDSVTEGDYTLNSGSIEIYEH